MKVLKFLLLLFFSLFDSYEVNWLGYMMKDYIPNFLKKLWICVLKGDRKDITSSPVEKQTMQIRDSANENYIHLQRTS